MATLQRGYTRCETDDEFSSRVLAKHGRYVRVKRERSTTSWYGHKVKEDYYTTECIDDMTGATLDDAVWNQHSMQRKIVEVLP